MEVDCQIESARGEGEIVEEGYCKRDHWLREREVRDRRASLKVRRRGRTHGWYDP